MNRYVAFALAGICAVMAVQFFQLSKLKREVATLRTQASVAPAPSSEEPASNPVVPSREPGYAALQMRVEQVEKGLANLPRTLRRGQNDAIVTEDELVRLEQVALNPDTPENERLNALRSLRRQNRLSDAAVMQTLAMLQNATNGNVRREMLQSLEGSTNAALKAPLLAMLDTAQAENGVREQAVNMLRRFVDDPTVESKLWDLALNDPNNSVRDQAREALARAPATAERIDQLLNRAANQDASLDERLLSFRALRVAKSHTPELVADLANVAQSSTDPIARAKLFKSFNGLTDQALMLPLVNGLQDTDPVVRQNAANALSEFPDPRVQQWLTHLIQNDADPVVKREAHAALERTQRLGQRPQ